MANSLDELKPLFTEFNAAIFSNPDFEIEGGARTPDQKPFDLKPLFLPAAMIAEHFMDHLKRSLTVTRDIDGAVGRPKMPKIIFSPDPRPNAGAQVHGAPAIRLNLGLVVALCSLPSTTSLISELIRDLSRHRNVSVSDFSELARARSAMLVTEIDSLMGTWRQSSAAGWRMVLFPARQSSDWWLYQEMLRFVIAHEFAHWLHSIYKEDFQRKLLDTAAQDIGRWLAEDQIADPSVIRNIQSLLRNSNILDRWKSEVCADAMGFQLCLQAFGGIQSTLLRAGAYAGAALTFGMNGILETFFEFLGSPTTGETHPSSYARYLIFTHILAKQFSLPHDEFLYGEFGIGMACSVVLGEVLSQYEARTKTR